MVISPVDIPLFKIGEILYASVIGIWDLLYRFEILKSHRLPVPVISIGNLTTGGTGKTPLVISLAQYLEAQGLTVAVLSRGYKATKKTRFHLADHRDYGDEAYLIQSHLKFGKVFVGANRVVTGKLAIQACNPDVILLDDGFQHRRLYRDLNIVLVDGTSMFGNAHLLPRGPLREPISALHRADWVLLTKTIVPEAEQKLWQLLKNLKLKHPVQQAPCLFYFNELFLPHTQTVINASDLKGKSVILVSALANPKAFEDSVKANIIQHLIYSDHHNYTELDGQIISQCMQEHPDTWVLTTEKDWVKLQKFIPFNLLDRVAVLQVTPQLNWLPILSSPYFSLKRAKQ